MIESGEYEECDDDNVDYSPMFEQTKRLASFIVLYNHISTDFNPIKFAKYGLFYNERYNVIICFSCRKKTPTKFKAILPGPVYKKNNFHLEECTLENNKPLQIPNDRVYEIIQIHLHKEYCANLLQPPATINESQPSAVLPKDPKTSISQKQQKPTSQQLSDYDSVDTRLATFSDWPSSSPVRPASLAEAGFIYLGNDDKVQCVYCQGKLSHWEAGDDPIQEHFRHFSTCLFILDMKMNNSALLTGTAKTVESTDSCTEQQNRNANVSSNASISNNSSTNSNFITVSSRMQTFKKWRHPTLTANNMSMAGFYFDEKKKSCKCFQCNIIITNWLEGDDPYKVHALKSPDCSYLLQIRGKQFVTDTVKTLSMVDRESASIPDYSSNDITEWTLPNLKETDALKDENEKLKDEKMCIVCMTEPKTILILPCAHLACCSTCASSLKKCPVCRTLIKGTVKIFQP